MSKLLRKILISSFIFVLMITCVFCIGEKSHAVNKHVVITFVGNQASGKTALRARLTHRDFDFEEGHPTMMSDKVDEIIPYDQDTNLVCTLWDTSGQASVKTQILNHRVRRSNFVAIAVDMAAALRAGFDNLVEQCVVEWCEAVRRNAPDSKIILVGTKLDSVDPDRLPEIRERFEAIPRIFPRFNYVLTSALRDEGLGEFFGIIRRRVNVEADDATHRVQAQQNGWCALL